MNYQSKESCRNIEDVTDGADGQPRCAVASGSPLPVLHGITFFPVPEFDDATVAFGAMESAYLPRRNLPNVPRELENLVEGLFFRGGALPELSPQVDKVKAMRAVKAWLRSFAPAHESKITTVAYALWVWTTLDQANTDYHTQPQITKAPSR